MMHHQQLMMMHHQHQFGYKKLSSPEDILWINAWTRRQMCPIFLPLISVQGGFFFIFFYETMIYLSFSMLAWRTADSMYIPVGIVRRHTHMFHDVSDGEGRRARDTRQTVDKHAPIGFVHFVWNTHHEHASHPFWAHTSITPAHISFYRTQRGKTECSTTNFKNRGSWNFCSNKKDK